ncbi:MAG: site-2 protease family protein [Halioglobus sp.]
MLQLMYQGQWALFLLIIISLIISLSFHEYGHAVCAKYFGDDTAQKLGRLTLNPVAHIDPMGLLMVVLIGFGYAKPVPTDPRNFNSRWASPLVAAAGPAMNLLLACISINLYVIGLNAGWEIFAGSGPQFFFTFLALINLLLMVFNLIPLGPLDGHYIMPYFLPTEMAKKYLYYNARYGNYLFLGLVVLSLAGLPIFKYVRQVGETILPLIIFF